MKPCFLLSLWIRLRTKVTIEEIRKMLQLEAYLKIQARVFQRKASIH